MYRKILLMYFFVFISAQTWAQQNIGWPQPLSDEQQLIRQTVGAYRNGISGLRFHRGLDLTQTCTNTCTEQVFATLSGQIKINTGPVSDPSLVNLEIDGQGVTLFYYHVNPAAGILSGDTVNVGTFIGTLYQFTNGITPHVHYQWGDGFNPLLDLTPFQDVGVPQIQAVTFFSHTQDMPFNPNILFGKVDISATGFDTIQYFNNGISV